MMKCVAKEMEGISFIVIVHLKWPDFK